MHFDIELQILAETTSRRWCDISAHLPDEAHQIEVWREGELPL
jgi:hypothetical protein